MKFTKVILLSLAVISFGCSYEKNTKHTSIVDDLPKTQLSWSDTLINLGNVNKRTQIPFSFSVKNTGTRPLTFVKIESTCGCTVVNTKDNKIILPGNTDSITGHINTSGLTGYIEKKIYVVANTSQGFYILTLKALN